MKIYFDTMGCPKNTNDSELAMGVLEKAGHTIVDNPEDADVITVNTCGFIGDAKKESIMEILEMAELCRGTNKKLVASGCMIQRYSEELIDEFAEVDGFLGVNDYLRFPELIDSMYSNPEGRFNFIGDKNQKGSFECEEFVRRIPENPYSCNLRISEGCNNHCTYCIIPKIRGRYRSRTLESIVCEAEKLARSGCKELVVIAQDTGCYGIDIYGENRLPQLLKMLSEVDGIRWIRLMYCYEENITDELIEVMANEEKVCPYIDIPIQHASDRMLKAMNRHSTRESLDRTIDKLRSRIPDIAIRTTLITGFPGETEDDLDQLLDFVEKQRFARLGAFAYSREEDTPAYSMENQVPEDVKKARLESVMLRQMEISLQNNQKNIGRVMEVMVDEKDGDDAYIGRTVYDAPEIDNSVIFSSDRELRPGDIVRVRINNAFDYDLEGEEV